MRLKLWKGPVLALGLAAAFGCSGGGSGSSSTTAPSAAAAAAPTIAIVGQNGKQAFTPNPANFGGQQVVFKNNDTVVHHIVLNDGSVDTGDIAPGATSRAVIMPSVGFWTRMLASSPTRRLFSLRQSMELTVPNSFGRLPTLPNLPTIVPSSRSL